MVTMFLSCTVSET